MDDHILYFAYGSNMALERLRERVSSAVEHGLSSLANHRLAFHKVSQKDGSAKCDAFYTGNPSDQVHGVLYWIHRNHVALLDTFEGRGVGYERRQVKVVARGGEPVVADSYFATTIDKCLRPYDWYMEHVLRGAMSRDLPAGYVRMIENVETVPDPDASRSKRELKIYDQ
jgi:gamma-glutamylcyclotransferase (GGCT)/AIG2-like uncharacterized protein YtfP